MKERKLCAKQTGLKEEELVKEKAWMEIHAADLCDEKKLQTIRNAIQAREFQKAQEREKLERERLAKMRKQQQEQWGKVQREHAEAIRKAEAERLAESLRRQEEYYKTLRQQQEAAKKTAAERQAANLKQQQAHDKAFREQQKADARRNQAFVENLPQFSQRPAAMNHQLHKGSCNHGGW
ncbi:hypothetical protein NX059_010206 [Plenodomus lindquistii]|nr:hypothetical protein NX059_010206 [Plenodomus lindquistii]